MIPNRLTTCLAAALVAAAPTAHAAGLIRDAEIERTLRTASEPIFKAAGLDAASVNMFIINDPSLNAFVAGGNNIFIHAGLVQRLPHVELFQAVIAHEVAHITGGHLAQRAVQAGSAGNAVGLGFLLGVAAAAAGGAPAGVGVAIGTADAVGKTLFKYSRTQESIADRTSVRYLADSNIDPAAIIDVLEMLDAQEALYGSGANPYVLSHPLPATRIAQLRNAVDQHRIAEGNSQRAAELAYWYARARAKFQGFLGRPARNLRDAGSRGNSETATIVRAISQFRLPDPATAIREADRLLDLRPNDPFYHELKGQILLESNQARAAVESYRKAVSIAGDEPLLLAGLGRAQLAARDAYSNDSALATLTRAYRLDPRDGRMLRDLAIAYQRSGQNGMASLATAERFALASDFRQAALHAARAQQQLAAGTADWQKARDILAAVGQVR